MALPAWVELDWARVQRWAWRCRAGHCRYEGLEATADGPLFRGHGDDCPGYGGVLVHDEDRPVIRIGVCPRRAAWWERRRAWLRDQRVTERAHTRGGRRPPFASE
jgi:hypothetical protein